jgi:hypothetical protein
MKKGLRIIPMLRVKFGGLPYYIYVLHTCLLGPSMKPDMSNSFGGC